MTEVAFKSLVTVLAVDALIILVSIPLVLRRVPRNRAYGVRTPATLADDRVWYEANAFGGKALIASSIASAIAIIGFVNVDGVAPQTVLNGSIACMAVPIAIAVIATLVYVRKLRG